MTDDDEKAGIRLQRVLAAAGLGSRRACELLIEEGRVEVDGKKVRVQGMRVDPVSAVIKVDGMRIATAPDNVYIVLNKPIGVVSTMSDPEGRPSLQEYVGDRNARLFHVGRLDVDTEGLILLTNDGDLAHALTHPSFEVPKTYRARVEGRLDERALRALRDGVDLEDGRTAPARVRRVNAHELELTIHEGRKRQVRRMLEAVGHRVVNLRRVAFGPLRLGELGAGRHRRLTAAEVERLREATRQHRS
jgi:pseudouridine synthase